MGHSAVVLSEAKHLSAQRDRPFAAAQGDSVRHLRLMPLGGLSWSPVGRVCCLFISLIARNRATLLTPAGDYEGHPYGSSGLRPLFMASVDAYSGR